MLRFKSNGEKKCDWFKVKFIDTLQLLDCSLSVLAKNLSTDYSLMPNTMAMKLQYPSITDNELADKGIFPYSYVDSWKKLEQTQLPAFEDFYDELSEAITITPAEYLRAQHMFVAFNCKTLFDYQLRYLELDCRLLADVFEHFRNLTRKEDGFDVAHFITISQLSYASALKKCNIAIELVKDPKMHRDIEKCKRGGYAFVNKH